MAGNLAGRGRLSDRLVRWTSPAQLFVIRLLLSASGLVLLTQLTPDTSYWGVILPAELLLGFGAGLAIPTVLNAAVAGVTAEDAGVASALFQTSNMMAASLGTAALSTVAVAVTAGTADAKAIAHGYSIAAACAAGVLLTGALFLALFLRGSRYVEYSNWGGQPRADARLLKPEV
ncbi:MFS transporter [Amycolatopsis alkalitolerans]|uniref:MFS transporter n=1 Tax=Amycolatopsis alkalitolerans TaxID=2547244 RepID=A0A5C4M2F8_9PSEU|nr:MFS transporter [Amycolatopsis alkalitolerans]TNC26408.1 MFS transporter [Amycolatopsis alkalitolerans]